MNDQTYRGLLIAGLCANVLFLTLALLDYAAWDSAYMWPVFVGWAFLVVLLVILALLSTGIRIEVVQERHVIERAPPMLERKPMMATLTSKAPPAPEPLPFVYNGYTLYSRKVELKNGSERTIWFFSKRRPASGTPAPKPVGFHVGVNERTGLPFLKRGPGADGEDLTPAIEHALRPQCSALTDDGVQCRNSARAESKYCVSHFGYQPPTMPKAEAARKDTLARVRGAPDTVPSVRKRAVS